MDSIERNTIRHLLVRLEVAVRNGHCTKEIHKQIDEVLGRHLKKSEK